MSHQPYVEVLGVYSPRAALAEYEAFLDAEVFAQNPVNFSEETKAFLSRVGRSEEIVDLPIEVLAELREDLDRELGSAVLVEVLVRDPDADFSVGQFMQPNPALPRGQWQVAWCEKFLTADGTESLGEYTFNELPNSTVYRLVFYIHDWVHQQGLIGPYGPLALPDIQPMPQRLWRLAPYEQVD